MKVSREVLKNIVKECLIEILQEGLNISPARKQPAQSIERVGVHEVRKPSPCVPTSVINEAAAGNPVFAAMFADTAKTTLPNVLQNDPGGAYGNTTAPAQVEKFAGTPEQVFGEAAATWANLAFAEAPNPGAGARLMMSGE